MQREMERFLAKIVNMMKDENLFATQGGPIILAQVRISPGYLNVKDIPHELANQWV